MRTVIMTMANAQLHIGGFILIVLEPQVCGLEHSKAASVGHSLVLGTTHLISALGSSMGRPRVDRLTWRDLYSYRFVPVWFRDDFRRLECPDPRVSLLQPFCPLRS
jgi:hypothetical protein